MLGLLALVLTTCAFAQGPGQRPQRQMDPEEMAKMQADRIKEACATTDAQYKKLYDYFLEEGKKMTEQMQQNRGGGPGLGNREEMQKRMQAQEDFIKGVLNEDQFKKYQEQRQNRRGGFGGPGGPDGPGGPGRRQR